MGRKVDRCTGHCCRDFTLPMGPEELWASYARWMAGGEKRSLPSMSGAAETPLYLDVHLIAPMVVYKGYHNRDSKRINPSDEGLLGKPESKAHHYTCKHFDPKAKACTIYEYRPAMCRSFPGPFGCNYLGCTWKRRRRKKQSKKELEKRQRGLRAPKKGEKSGS